MSEDSRCCSLALAEGETASVTLVLSSKNASAEAGMTGMEEHIASVVAPLGFRVQIIWVDKNAPAAEWSEAFSSFCLNPWMWTILAAVVAILAIAGLKGLFWTLFWGAAAWFLSKVLVSLVFRKRTLFFAPAARR